MMNKRYKKRLLAAWIVCCGLCSLISCTLDESPRDQIPEEAAYQTATSLFQNTVATLYTRRGEVLVFGHISAQTRALVHAVFLS